MKMKASIVLASHVSDLQMETGMIATTDVEKTIQLRLGFIKYLNWKLQGDFRKEINPDKLFKQYLKVKENSLTVFNIF